MSRNLRLLVCNLCVLISAYGLLAGRSMAEDALSGSTRSRDAGDLPAKLRPLAREADVQFARGHYLEAEKIYRRILGKTPNEVYALANLGAALVRAGKLDQAEKPLKRAVTVAPEDGFLHCVLGIVYYREGKMDGAIPELLMAVAINSKSEVAPYYLGLAAGLNGGHETPDGKMPALPKRWHGAPDEKTPTQPKAFNPWGFDDEYFR